MIQNEVNEMIRRAKTYDNVVIVGAGKAFYNLLCLLRNNDIVVSEAFDNNDLLVGKLFDGVKIVKPYKCIDNTVYIIDSKSKNVVAEFCKQLKHIGIKERDIIRQPHVIVDGDLDILDRNKLKNILDQLYYERFGFYINWDNPSTYNEIINWEKIYDHDDRKRELADKYLVREYVKEKVGEDFLTNLIGVWDSENAIDFTMLPEKYVLKTNNGSSRNIIITDKKDENIPLIKEKLSKWMVSDYWKGLLEFQYKGIKPLIICEEYLEDVDDANEFKFYCFNGKVEFIGCERNSHKPGWSGSIYDLGWHRQEFGYAVPNDPVIRARPLKLEEMVRISEKLSEGFRQVRVDLYELPNGKILFGEMTFSSWGGMKHFFPEIWDKKFGELVQKS